MIYGKHQGTRNNRNRLFSILSKDHMVNIKLIFTLSIKNLFILLTNTRIVGVLYVKRNEQFRFRRIESLRFERY